MGLIIGPANTIQMLVKITAIFLSTEVQNFMSKLSIWDVSFTSIDRQNPEFPLKGKLIFLGQVAYNVVCICLQGHTLSLSVVLMKINLPLKEHLGHTGIGVREATKRNGLILSKVVPFFPAVSEVYTNSLQTDKPGIQIHSISVQSNERQQKAEKARDHLLTPYILWKTPLKLKQALHLNPSLSLQSTNVSQSILKMKDFHTSSQSWRIM